MKFINLIFILMLFSLSYGQVILGDSEVTHGETHIALNPTQEGNLIGTEVDPKNWTSV